MAQDYIIQHHININYGIHLALQDVTSYLDEHVKTPKDFGLPSVTIQSLEVAHELECWAPYQQLFSTHADAMLLNFNVKQLVIYNAIIDAVFQGNQLLTFVDGKASQGKMSHAHS